MIDTITVVLHNCNQYRKRNPQETELEHQIQPYEYYGNHRLYLALKEKENKYIERHIDMVQNEIIDNARPKDLLGKKVVKRSWVYQPRVKLVSQDEEVLFALNTRGKYNLASSNYNVVYNIKSGQDSIEFTMSVPKYMYAHSIAQFVPNQDSKRFMNNPSRMSDISYQAEILIDRLHDFVRVFFKDLALSFKFDLNIELENIELRRIDLCYNQIHHTKKMALAMINAQKKRYKRRLRKDNKTHKDEKTALYYRNSKRTFFFKIYHKGSEFNKQGDSDFKRLMKFNKEHFKDNFYVLRQRLDKVKLSLNDAYKNTGVEELFSIYSSSASQYLNVKFVQEFEKLMPYKVFFLLCEADKIVRYEMNFTNTYMTSFYKKEVFCKFSTDYKNLLSRYNKTQAYYNHQNKGNINKARDFKRRYNITNQCITDYEATHNFLAKKNRFFFRNEREIYLQENGFVYDKRVYKDTKSFKWRVLHEEKATFSTDLFKEMYRMFYDEVLFFKIDSVSNPMSIMDKVDKYNLEVLSRKEQYEKFHGKNSIKKLTRGAKMKLDMIEFNRSRLKTFLEALDGGKSLQQIKEDYNIKKSAYYDLLAILKKFSLNEKSIKSQYDFKDVRTDFHTYNSKLSSKQYSKQFFSPNDFIAVRSDSYMYKHAI